MFKINLYCFLDIWPWCQRWHLGPTGSSYRRLHLRRDGKTACATGWKGYDQSNSSSRRCMMMQICGTDKQFSLQISVKRDSGIEGRENVFVHWYNLDALPSLIMLEKLDVGHTFKRSHVWVEGAILPHLASQGRSSVCCHTGFILYCLFTSRAVQPGQGSTS